MNKNALKIIIPLIAILVIAESMVLISKLRTTTNLKTGPVELKPATNQPVTLKFEVDTNTANVGSLNEVPLFLSSDKDVFVDALDLYIKYDPSAVVVTEAIAAKSFVAPSFKKVNPEKGMVVMNFLVSEASGFKLTKGVKVEIARLKVNYLKEGVTEFALGEGTLVVENGSAKMLPFNSEKLVINVSR